MYDLNDKIRALFVKNRRECGAYTYTVPSPESYPYQWFWDSCFHAVILSHLEPEYAKRELTSLMSAQLESGLFPHIIYWEPNPILNINWGTPGVSSLTQPPIIAYALKRVLAVSTDTSLLANAYPKLVRYYKNLLSRDKRNNHLISIINPDESGEDNSPRFDGALGLTIKQTAQESFEKRSALFEKNKECNFDPLCVKDFFWVKDLPFNVFMVENLTILAEFATTLGHTNDAEYFTHHAMLIQNALRVHMFKDGIFQSVVGPEYTPVPHTTWALFAPLLIDAYTQDEAEALVNTYLHSKEYFGTPYPLPSTAVSDAAFDPNESSYGAAWQHPNWRGPVWMSVNWFVYRGLMRYGFKDEAKHIRQQSESLIIKNGFREYYHPHTGEGIGSHSFTWGGLVIDMQD